GAVVRAGGAVQVLQLARVERRGSRGDRLRLRPAEHTDGRHPRAAPDRAADVPGQRLSHGFSEASRPREASEWIHLRALTRPARPSTALIPHPQLHADGVLIPALAGERAAVADVDIAAGVEGDAGAELEVDDGVAIGGLDLAGAGRFDDTLLAA